MSQKTPKLTNAQRRIIRLLAQGAKLRCQRGEYVILGHVVLERSMLGLRRHGLLSDLEIDRYSSYFALSPLGKQYVAENAKPDEPPTPYH